MSVLAIEFGGYTGWGLWLIIGVMAFNLAAIPAWFLVGSLKRSHEFQLKKARTFIELLRRTGHDRSDLAAQIASVEAALEQGEGLGPIWGRKHIHTAQLILGQLEERYPDLVGPIWETMRRD